MAIESGDAVPAAAAAAVRERERERERERPSVHQYVHDGAVAAMPL